MTGTERKATTEAPSKAATEPRSKIMQGIGPNLKEIISALLFNSKSQAICELIANSYDADATLVEINYNPLADSMIIKDNGLGMDHTGLIDFYRFGASSKQNNPTTAAGRKVLGRFGVAKSAIRSLAFADTLTTFRDGNKYSVKEVFLREVLQEILVQDENFTAKSEAYQIKHLESLLERREAFPDHLANSDLGKKISGRFGALDAIVNNGEWGDLNIDKGDCSADLQGTVVEMGPMRFDKRDGLDLAHLEKKIRMQYGLLLSDSFTVMLNGRKISPFKIINSVSYDINTSLPRCGPVSGKIFYSKEKIDNPGIHLYVDGREIGSGDIIDLNKVKLSLGKHMTGQIHVDELRNSIQLDRENIIYDDPKFVELKKYLMTIVNQIRTDLERGERQKQNKKVYSIFKSVSRKIDSYFEKAKLRDSGKGNNARLKIELADSSKAGAIAKYDPGTHTISINQDQFITYSADSSILPRLEQLLLTFSVLAISKSDYDAKMPEHSRAIDSYFDHTFMLSTRMLKHEKSKTLAQLLSGVAGLIIPKNPDKMMIIDSRLYNLVDLPDVTGRPSIVFKKLAESGVIAGEGPWKGSDIRKACWSLYGYKTLSEIVREMPNAYKAEAAGVFYVEKENSLLMKISSQERLPAYIKKIEGTRPVFLVKSTAVSEFLNDFSSARAAPEKQDPVWGLMQSIEYITNTINKQINAGTLRSISRNEPDQLSSKVGISEVGKSVNGYDPEEIRALAEKISTDSDFRIRYNIY